MIVMSACPDREGVGEVLQVVPLADLRGPRLLRRQQGCDDQDAGRLEGEELVDGGQGDHGLASAEPHVQEESGGVVLQDEVLGVLLVRIGRVYHFITSSMSAWKATGLSITATVTPRSRSCL